MAARGPMAAIAGRLLVLARHPAFAAVKQPLLMVILLWLAEVFSRWLAERRRLAMEKRRVRRVCDKVDSQYIQCCLMSMENLPTLGRVEKRTLFVRPLMDVLCGNRYLAHELLKAASECRKSASNCMVTKWLKPDERYHVLQASLNAVSSIFGPNYVHFNAVEGDTFNLFKSTWYCLCVMTPSKKPDGDDDDDDVEAPTMSTMVYSSFVDETRRPPATLRIVLVNESDLRRVADSKLRPPSSGFFNKRHELRYGILVDFARNFQLQLIRTPSRASQMASRSPFTSAKAHKHVEEPDGGFMKRVRSQPDFADEVDSGNLSCSSVEHCDKPKRSTSGRAILMKSKSMGRMDHTNAERHIYSENCFLRIHIPHFVGGYSQQQQLQQQQQQRQQMQFAEQLQQSQKKSSGTRPFKIHEAFASLPSRLPEPDKLLQDQLLTNALKATRSENKPGNFQAKVR